MKRHPLTIAFMFSIFLVLACAGVVLANLLDVVGGSRGHSFAKEGIVQLDAGLTQTSVFAGGDGTLGLALTLTCDQMSMNTSAKRNVDLVVVLDRSGSMAGRKIEDARRAIVELLSALGPGDRFALVSYANDVTVHGTLSPVTWQTRSMLTAMTRSIQAGGGTNLSGGMVAGMELLTRKGDRPMFNPRMGKVILISDGHANQGVTDPLALGGMAAHSFRSNFTITTVGVGVDYNEQLMGVIADYGGGNYYFLENPALFADLFLEELSLTRAVAARNLEIKIPLPKGVTLLSAAGYPVEMSGRTVVLRPGSLRSGQERTFFLTLSLERGIEQRYVLSGITASYQHGDKISSIELDQPLVFQSVGDSKAAVASIDTALWEQQTMQEDYNKLREEVSRDLANGDKDAALGKITLYENEKRMLNAHVGSKVVADNLDTDMVKLKEAVENSLALTASPMARKQAAKAMQSESYDQRRAKMK